MSGVANGDGTPVDMLFGFPLPDGTGAAGSTASRTRPPDTGIPHIDSGIPGTGTALPLFAQTGRGESASLNQPGQNDTSIMSPGPADEYASHGPYDSGGHADHWRRYSWQALAEGERADRAWRRERAAERAERYPERWPTVEDAMRDIPDPVGGGAWLVGETDDIVAAVRRIDPARGVRNLGGELPDGAVTGYAQGPDGRGLTLADTRPPWARGE